MPKQHTPDARLEDMKAAFIKQCGELWVQHEERFMGILQESESKKVKVTFAGTLDFTESKAALETTISYSQVVKDKRRDEFEDPNQVSIQFDAQSDDTLSFTKPAKEEAETVGQ